MATKLSKIEQKYLNLTWFPFLSILRQYAQQIKIFRKVCQLGVFMGDAYPDPSLLR